MQHTAAASMHISESPLSTSPHTYPAKHPQPTPTWLMRVYQPAHRSIHTTAVLYACMPQ